MKLLVSGLWVVGVALGTAYAVALYLPGGTEGGKAAAATVVLQSQKSRVINVPIVVDGALRGFVAAQFTFTEDAGLLKTLQVLPDAYLLDEAFRAIYADSDLEPKHVEKYDLKRLTDRVLSGTNARLGVALIKDVLIENFTYVDKDAGKS